MTEIALNSAAAPACQPAEPSCATCSCSHARDCGSGDRVFFATEVSHTLTALRTVLKGVSGSVAVRAPGLVEVSACDPTAVLSAASAGLSQVEADEVRVAVVGAAQGDSLLVAAFTAPTLSQAGARVRHADLLPLLQDELNTFHSVYQPIVSLKTGSDNAIIGYEALLRATGPAGPVMPDDLFSAAARAGWLHILDRVGRTSALRGGAGWLGQAQLFINFVPTSIYRPEICLQTTEQAAAQAGLRLDQLVFEVTESEQVPDIDHLSHVFDYYRERGCKVALDDLGAGFSSLNMLVRLQPDVVKLDKQIVQGLPDPVSSAVVAAIVEMTHSYGGSVLAECVETAEQASAASMLGVDLAQGWYYGRPERRESTRPQRLAA